HRPTLLVEDALPGDDVVFADLLALDHLAADGLGKVLPKEAPHLVAKGEFVGTEAKVHGGASVDLEEPGGSHAAADAHGDDAALRLAAFAFDQDVAGHARAAHAVGMADRNRAAVDVENLLRNAEAVAAVERLARERLVQLPQIDVIHLQAL